MSWPLLDICNAHAGASVVFERGPDELPKTCPVCMAIRDLVMELDDLKKERNKLPTRSHDVENIVDWRGYRRNGKDG